MLTNERPTRNKALALVPVLGVIIAVILALTAFDSVATPYSSPHQQLDSPELATVGVDKLGKFYDAQPIPKGTLPGTMRRSEPIPGAPKGIRLDRIVYVSETADGKAQEVSGLFAVKDGAPPPPNGRPLITVAHGTSGVAPGCGISQNPLREGSNDYFWWYFYIQPLVNAGYTVVASDYANLGVPGVSNYMVMKGAAADVLNAARAATQYAPDETDASRMAIWGHSQGGFNALSAAYLWPSYAPELPIKGVVAQAPVFFPPIPLMQAGIEDGPGGSDATGAAFNAHLADAVASWSENYPNLIKPSDVYTDRGLDGYNTATKKCIIETIAPLTGQYSEMVKNPIMANLSGIFNINMPVHRRFEMPLMIQQGLQDTVVIPDATIGAYRTFCKQGSTAVLQTFPADVHSSLLHTAFPNALSWTQDRFAGLPAPSTCTNT